MLYQIVSCMFESKIKLLAVIRQLVLLIVGAGLSGFSVLMACSLASEWEPSMLAGTCLIAFIGTMSLFVGVSSAQKITVDLKGKLIQVRFLWIIVNTYKCKDLCGSKNFTLVNKFGSYRGYFIETNSGEQIAFTELDFINFTTLREAVATVASRNNSLKRKFWLCGTKQTLWATIVALIMISALVITRYCS